MYLVPVLEYTCWVFLKHLVKSWKLFCLVSFVAPELLWNWLRPSLPPIFRSMTPIMPYLPINMYFFFNPFPSLFSILKCNWGFKLFLISECCKCKKSSLVKSYQYLKVSEIFYKKKEFLKILQNSEKKTCTRVSF